MANSESKEEVGWSEQKGHVLELAQRIFYYFNSTSTKEVLLIVILLRKIPIDSIEVCDVASLTVRDWWTGSHLVNPQPQLS